MYVRKFDYIANNYTFFHPVVDVSAQASCTITPISPTTLTAAGGVLPNGTENVMIRCNCSEDDGSVITYARWYGPNESRINRVRTGDDAPNIPYFKRPDDKIRDNRNIILVIPTFNDSYDGTYTCGRRDSNANDPPLPPTATISLNSLSK